jgi:ABC-type polysaccharide transport system permease subunit
MELTNDEGTFSRKIISGNGKINFVYNADWYDDEFIIKIISNNDETGYISIIYRFSTI